MQRNPNQQNWLGFRFTLRGCPHERLNTPVYWAFLEMGKPRRVWSITPPQGIKPRVLKMAKGKTPGTRADRSGQYEQIGPRGGHTGREVTVVRGEPLPPTPKPGMTYELVDPSRNDAGRGKGR